MSTDIFIGVDGTGPYSDSDYATSFAKSHVKQLHATWSHGRRAYRRGPSLEGLGTGPLALWATRIAKEELEKAGDGARLFLCGYSRGGAAVIQTARNLAWSKIKVHHLMLFDAVDRSLVMGTGRIPDNVAICSHARRDPKAGSREMFGNCGTKAGGQTKYKEEYFFCTHGGVGGMPWTEASSSGKIHEIPPKTAAAGMLANITNPSGMRAVIENTLTNVTLEQDKVGAKESWTWMQKRLAASLAAPATG